MTETKCRHGLAEGTCEICRVLDAGTTGSTPVERSPVLRGRSGSRIGLGVGAVAALVVFFLVAQVVAAAWAVFHLVQLVAVALVAGWIGWRVGLVQGKRRRV